MTTMLFCKGLAEHNPEDSFCPKLAKRKSWIAADYWAAIPHILGTELNDTLLDKYGDKEDEYEDLYNHLCVPLIEEVEALFEQHGVPWRAGSLFVIGKKQTGHKPRRSK